MVITEQDLIMSSAILNSADVDQEMRIKNLLRTWHGVPSPDKEFNQKLAWCLEHCESKFRDMKVLEERIWYFKNEHDASMFALKWS